MTQEQMLAALTALVDALVDAIERNRPVDSTALNDAREAVRLLNEVGFQ
jgi:hypothetical protein